MRNLHILLFLISFSPVFGQVSSNMTLNSNWNDTSLPTSSGVRFNDIWGYVDCQGREYAIVGSARFTHFFDVTNPNNINEVSRVEGTVNSIWRDYKTYKNFAYGVADQGNEGLSIFNLANLPNSAFLVKRDDTNFTRAHNIFIDEEYGRLYVAGSNGQNNGLIVYDLNNDPANPQKIASVGLPNGGYVHDIYVRDNIAYCSHGFNGYYIWNMIDPENPIALAATETNGYNHSSWVTDDGNYAVVAEEVPAGLPLLMIDLTNLATGEIQVVKDFKEPLLAPSAINNTPHNPFIRGKHVISSYYEDGVQVFDISDPLNPVRIAYYDTEPNNTSYNGTTGNWGVYPYLPSGTIIATDTDNGLFVLTPTYDDVEPVSFSTEPNVEWVDDSDINVCDGETVVLQTTGTAENYRWFKDGELIEGEIGNSLTIQSGGEFRLEVDNVLCSKDLSPININFQALPSVEFTPLGISTIKLCEGNSSTVSVPLGAQTYSWTKDGNFFSESNSIDIIDSGIYQVTASTNGCPAVSEIIEVEVTPFPNVDLSVPDSIAICFGDTTLLEIEAGADEYKWFLFGVPLNGEDQPTLKASATGSYYVEATNNGCTSVSDSVKIQTKPLPLAEIEATEPSLCEGASTTIFTNQGADTYVWTLNDETFEGTDFEINTNQAGTYQVSTTLDGCTNISEAINIEVNNAPDVTLNSSEDAFICENEVYSLVVPEGTASFQWFRNDTAIEGATNHFLDISESGIYFVEAIKGTCSSTSTPVEVTVRAFAPVDIINPTQNLVELCEGEEIELATADRDAVFQWFKDGTPLENTNQNILTVNENGIYQVRVDQNNCFDVSREVEVTVTAFPSVELNVDTIVELCQGESIQLTMADEQGTFQWFKDGEMIENGDSNMFEVDESGSYFLQATNGNCTATSDTIEVTVTPRPIANIVQPQQSTVELCEGELIEFLAVPQEGTYQWLQNGNDITNTDDNTLIVASAGVYQMMITNNGCSNLSQEIQVNTTPFPDVSLNLDTSISICEEETVTAEIPEGAGLYQWFFNGAAVETANSNNFEFGESGTYYVNASNNSCSADSDTITLNVNELPNASFTNLDDNTIDICEGETTTLSVSEGADQYLWTKNGVLLELPTIEISSIEVSEAGTYQVVITKNNCTSTSDEVILNVNSLPSVDLNTDTNIAFCEGESATIEVPTGADTYQWFKDELVIEGVTTNALTIETSGDYYVVVTSNNCALSSATVQVTVSDFPDATLLDLSNDDIMICEGETSILSVADNADTYQWIKDDEAISNANAATIEISEAGIYRVEVTQNGCTSTSSDVNLMVAPTPNVDLNTTNEINLCINPNFTLSIEEGADMYQWFFNETPIDDATTSNLEVSEPGLYSVLAQLGECDATSEIIEAVTQATIDTVNTGDLIACEGETFSINTTALPGSFEWIRNGEVVDTTSTNFEIEEAGDYQLVIYENDCPISVQKFSLEFVDVPSALVIVDGETTFCEGDFVTLQTLGDDPNFTYNWYLDGFLFESGSSIMANISGNYELEVQNEVGCVTYSELFEVTVNPLPEAIISVEDQLLTSTANESYQWYLEGVIIPNATNQLYMAEVEGNYSVQVMDSNGCSAFSESVFVMVTSTQTIESISTVELFPNPASDIVTLRFESDKSNVYELTVLNTIGQIIHTQQTDGFIGNQQATIDVENWESGVYLLQIRDQDQFLYRKIIVE